MSIPERLTYRKKEVIQISKLDGRVLDFWEKEFGLFCPVVNRSGEKFYSRHDLEMILKIKQILLVEKKDKAEVRSLLGEEFENEPQTHEDFPEGTTPPKGTMPPKGTTPSKAIRHLRNGLKEILTLLDKNDKK